MHEMTLPPNALMGLFLAHRAANPKGIEQVRAALDAERWFFAKPPLLEVREVEVDDGGKKVRGSRVEASLDGPRTCRLERHVFVWLRDALRAAVDEGKLFCFAPKSGQGTVEMASEAHAAIESAREVDVAKEPPRVVEGKKKAGA